MFTGIITDIGRVAAVTPQSDPLYRIETGLPLAALKPGDSVACNGICLTAVELLPRAFVVQVSAETLDKTTAGGWQAGMPVNLELALRAGDALGGHIVSGHVDGVATVLRVMETGDSLRLFLEAPQALRKYIARKGSVTLDGVSLTVNDIDAGAFGVNIIPHTRAATTLGGLQAGARVNCEIDMIARYLERLLEQRSV